MIRIGMVGGRRDKDQDGFSGKQEFSDFKKIPNVFLFVVENTKC